MTTITSIYIPQIESKFDAEFIANVFHKNGLAQISKIYIEPCKSNTKNGLKNQYYINNYNNAYIEIGSWYNTETANNFIECMLNPSKEARIIYGYNNWWKVYINNYPDKLASKNQVLTIFKDNTIIDDNWSTTCVTDHYMDYKKTNSKKIHHIEEMIDKKYDRELKAAIYGYQNADEMESAESFDGYLHEMVKKQTLLVNKYL
jgi:hypothetical protein